VTGDVSNGTDEVCAQYILHMIEAAHACHAIVEWMQGVQVNNALTLIKGT
jgi:hypothetical protein